VKTDMPLVQYLPAVESVVLGYVGDIGEPD
jgi:hypothetical protein